MSHIKNLSLKLDSFELQVTDLTILDSGVTAFWGKSGSGKSTLFKTLIGLYQPKGWVWNFKGEDLHKLTVSERRLGVVFQNYELFPHLTAEENILIVIKSRYSAELRSEALASLENYKNKLNLNACWQTEAQKLSGGEKQRVSLLRALMSRPRLLLLDEPFSALDPALRREARLMVKDLLQSLSIPVYMITHDVEDIQALAESVVQIVQGEVKNTYSKEQFLSFL